MHSLINELLAMITHDRCQLMSKHLQLYQGPA